MSGHAFVLRTRRRVLAVLSAVPLALAGLATVPASAATAPAVSAAFSGGSGTFTNGQGTVYARSGQSLTLTVTTSSDAQCIDVQGSFTGHQTSATTKTSWTFTFTALAGDGAKGVTVNASPSFNKNDVCTGPSSTTTASYVADNTGPTVTGVVTPNASGWNNTNATVTWSASDSGSGVASVSAPTVVTTDGTFLKSGSATDKVGNTGSGSVTVQVDKSAPTISGSASGQAGLNGWYTGPATVSFSCDDAVSGVATCLADGTTGSSRTVSTSATVTGTATDRAGNTASASVPVKVDLTGPALNGAPTSSPNANGWYRGDVAVHWTASDPESGVPSQPADTTITGEGTGLTSTTTATNGAGLTTTGPSSPAVKIDRTAPTTSVSGTPVNDWTNGSVTLSLSASDSLSGVDKTFFSVNGAPQTSGTSITLGSEGDNTVTFWSVDRAGNTESAHTVHVRIDKTAPTIGHAFTPVGYHDGDWTNAPVTVTFTCADQGGSGLASCTSPVTRSDEGEHTVTGTAADNAGNTATDAALVRIDLTKPVITATASGAPSAHGWYDADVTVSYSCSDALSGIAHCPAADVLGEGADQSASGTATDAAGNTASAGVSGIDVDETAPTLTADYSTAWHTADVTVTWRCHDALSGVVAPDGTVVGPDRTWTTAVGGEGDDLSDAQTCTDAAGNSTTTTADGIRIDRHAPTTTASYADTPASGWYRNGVEVALHRSDNLSGVASTTYTVDGGDPQTYSGPFTVSGDGTHTVRFHSTDVAGNVEDPPAPVVLHIDGTAPTTQVIDPISPASGWFVTSGIPFAFDASDNAGGSGIAATYFAVDGGQAETYGEPFTRNLSDGPHTITYWSVDVAGNEEQHRSFDIGIDTTAPTVTASQSPAANAAGWNNTDVHVTLACTDPGADASGIASCLVDGTQSSAVTLSAEGDDLTVSGTATDVAGNAGHTTYGPVRIDKTAPTLTGHVPAPNAHGWYNHDVTVSWTGDDSLSGVDPATLPADSVVTGEGADLGATAQVADLAGNVGGGSISGIEIDRTAPVTGVSGGGDMWRNGDVTVTLTPTDNLSGVDTTFYSVDGGDPQTGTSVVLTTEGDHTIAFHSVDNAGNVEPERTVHVKIDKTAPTISHVFTPSSYVEGSWTNHDVTVTFVCDDQGGSLLDTCSPPVTKSDEGQYDVVGTATDHAGNSATDHASVRIDKTAPTVDATVPSPNGNGWYDSDVTVTFTCADHGGSGIATCPAATTLHEGADQSASGTATDVAGNEGSGGVDHVNVDETKPVLTADYTPGWHRGDVLVHWTCTDALSGVDVGPSDDTVTGEGYDLGSSASCTDKAGNTAAKTVSGIMIDRHGPKTTASSGQVPASGWYAGPVTVTLDATDDLSGVAATTYSVDGGDDTPYDGPFTVSADGMHTIRFASTDVAGNAESPGTYVVRIDTTKPGIVGSQSPAANSFGWNNGPVAVSFSCTDEPAGTASGVAGCAGDTLLTNEGGGQSVNGDAVDVAGNTSHTTYGPVNIDLTAPSLTGTPEPANAAGWYRHDVTVHWTSDDALSGIDPSTTPADSVVTGEGRDLKASASVADKAGNVTKATVGGLKIDRTGPTVTGKPTSEPNAAGWYHGNVVVDWTCADPVLADGTNGSGVASCPTSSVVSGDGIGQSVTSGLPVDIAGNTGSAGTVAGIDIDGTAPVTKANNTCTSVNDWCTGATADVVLTASDNLSGVQEIHYRIDGGQEQVAAGSSTTVTVPLTGSGSGTVTYWSVDVAGNVEAPNQVGLKWDNIAPTVTHSLSPAANALGWNNSDVTVSFSAKDDDHGSGVASVSGPQTISTETSGTDVVGTAHDTAGNVGTDHVTIRLDKTKPTITGAVTKGALGDNGWYVGPVTVSFTCTDERSGVAVCPDPVVLTANGAGQSAPGTVTDVAGNQASTTVDGIKIDQEKPAINPAAVNVNGQTYTLGSVPKATCTATDAFSGVASCTVAVTGGNTNGVGTFTWTATAKDNAGNVSTATGTFKVGYRFDGFLQPINDTAHQVGATTSIFKAGSTVPVKLVLKDAAGNVVQPTKAPEWLTPVKGSSTAAPVDESVYTASGDSGTAYRADSGQWIYNWKTPSGGGNYWRIGVALDDGTTYYVNIGLR